MEKKRNFIEFLLSRIIIMGFYFAMLMSCLMLPRVKELFERKDTLNVYAFTEMVSPEAIEEFERETGIKVRIQYFESNEELHAKFRVNEGEGYDLITPSDYMIELLRKEALLYKLDRAKIPNLNAVDQKLMGHFFDPGNNYSVPLAWHCYGIVYDKQLLGNDVEQMSFDYLFVDPAALLKEKKVKAPFKICMMDDARDSVFTAAIYLFGTTRNLSEVQLQKIQDVLVQQKLWVEAYTSTSVEYFLLGNIVGAAFISSLHMKKILDLSSRFGFKIPREGSMGVIENFAIPIHCKKIDQAHQFINFMISKKIAAQCSIKYGYNPVNKEAYALIDQKFLHNQHFFPADDFFRKRLHLGHNDVSLKRVEDVWLGVKFA